ncbi:MAG: polyprenyl synthetase family protein, partial [Elusimicrobia bacterium]|nr:polyprenyl synthetase family protein [Elusimicrobiota bacterium]
MNSLLSRYMGSTAERVEAVLDRLLGPKAEEPADIRKAMRYSIFAGGKRLRPALVIAGAECCGGRAARVL